MNLNEQINHPLDWDVKIYLIRKIKAKYVATLVSKFAMFDTSARQMQAIANKFNNTKLYIFEYKKINYNEINE